jgi:PPP family 3-phenylpropionic acid transporter
MVEPPFLKGRFNHEGENKMDLSVQREAKASITFRILYFLIFFGIGALFPLLGVYLKEQVKLSGMQIGNIMSVGPVVMILIQPMWGIFSDYTQKPRHILFFALLLTGIMGYIYTTTQNYGVLLLIAVLLAFAQSAIVPISDSITLTHVQKRGGAYGSIRLYGAVGFAVAVLVAGKTSEYFSMYAIFYLFAGALFTAALLITQLPRDNAATRGNIREGSKHLLRDKQFALFLLCTFLIFGPIYANNTYFGLFITDLGGTLTGVGLAFLLAAGSEAPFMKWAEGWIQKWGVTYILLFSACISALRWLFYFFEPPLLFVYATTISQGLSIGLFIPAALQYVRQLAPLPMQSTAVALYATAGGGFGTWFCTFTGGVLMDRFGVENVYIFFFILTCVGIALLVWPLHKKVGV